MPLSIPGGLDSGAVVTLANELGFDIHTFSLGDMEDDEEAAVRPLARLIATRCGTKHSEIILDPETLLDDLDDMVSMIEPYGGGLPSWYIV